MSSREKFTASLKDVFTVKPAPRTLPPPPPSSRRPRVSSISVPPPPVRRRNAASEPPSPVSSDEPSAHLPDSLIPVRFTDLIDEAPGDAVPAMRGSRRNATRVLGALVGGAVLALVALAVFTRTGTKSAAQPSPWVRPPSAAAIARPDPPQQPAPSITSVELAPVPSVAPVEDAKPVTAAELLPSATEQPTSVSLAESAEKPSAPPRRKRKRPSAPAYEPPTASFPDYEK